MTTNHTITVCLIGDDREREYPVTYSGVADFPRWARDNGTTCGELAVALVRTGEDKEALVAAHPDYGWCSVGDEFCRDFSPAIDDARLEQAG